MFDKIFVIVFSVQSRMKRLGFRTVLAFILALTSVAVWAHPNYYYYDEPAFGNNLIYDESPPAFGNNFMDRKEEKRPSSFDLASLTTAGVLVLAFSSLFSPVLKLNATDSDTYSNLWTLPFVDRTSRGLEALDDSKSRKNEGLGEPLLKKKLSKRRKMLKRRIFPHVNTTKE